MPISSGYSKVFLLVTDLFATELTLSQKLDTNHTLIEPLTAATILGRCPYFFLVGSDFIILRSTFPMSAFNKFSRISIESFLIPNSRKSFA